MLRRPVALIMLVVVVAIYLIQRAQHDGAARFAGVQQRGAGVMGVDQYTSAHVFEDLPTGGRIVLDRDDSADSAGIRKIREHMRDIATAFRGGDFSKPFAVHAEAVPGTAVMAERHTSITYDAVDRKAGAEVDIKTTDSTAIAAIHQFLAFQREDHHAAAHEHAPGMTMP